MVKKRTDKKYLAVLNHFIDQIKMMSQSGQPVLVYTNNHLLLFHEILNKISVNALCENNGNCDNCNDCQLINSAMHPNVNFKDIALDKLTLDDIRQYIASINSFSSANDCHLLIISNFNLLSEKAQNTLLKHFEDVPKNNAVILLASSNQNILTTISSRCFIVNFAIEYRYFLKTFCQNYECSEFDYFSIYRLAASPDAFNYFLKSPMLLLAQKAVKSFIKDPLNFLAQPFLKEFYCSSKEKQLQFLNIFLSAYCYLIVENLKKTQLNKYNDSAFIKRAIIADDILNLQAKAKPLNMFYKFITSDYESSIFI